MKQKKQSLLFLLMFGGFLALNAQNVGVGVIPDPSAKLDISAPDKGLLIPRVTLTDVSIATPVTLPATGLLVFNTSATVTGGSGQGFYYWTGTQWSVLATGSDLDQQSLTYNAGTGDLTISNGNVVNIPDNQSLSIVGNTLFLTNGGSVTLPTSTGATGPMGPAGANGIDGTNGLDGAVGATGATGAAGTNGLDGAVGATGATGAAGTNGIDGTNGLDGAVGATGATGAAGTNGLDGINGTNGLDGAVGATGAAGTNGIDGTNGTNGIDGTNGLDGAVGATGAAGTNGIDGTNGLDGAVGATGAAGTNGIDGTNGTNGLDGAVGATGATGAAGTNGIDGTNGTNGIDGINGTNGLDGAVGATGATGAAGTNGIDGTNGTNGLDGAVGATGATGANGLDGAVGATGAAGTNGIDGTNGTNGLDGAVGATGATGAAGTNGIDGTNGTNGLDGAVGATGAAGTNGIDGINGTNGLDGAVGATGATGAAGTNGIDGINGTNGLDGAVGATGATGANGIDGTNGTNGLDGAVGATGATGAAGTNGIDGTNGTNGLDGAVGAVGATGAAGTNGIDGTNGLDGAVGATGAAGTNGIDGTNGTNGLDGAVGATGAAGTNGIDGTNGTNGIDGVNGIDGINGTNGLDGATGTAGTNGLDGATGAQGPMGANGQDGIDGINGADGINGTNGLDGATGATGATGPAGPAASDTDDQTLSYANGVVTIVDGNNITIPTNALNTLGLVPGPTAANPNMVWGTDAAGNPSWLDPSQNIDVDNGLYYNTGAGKIRQGGPLVENTTITQGAFNYLHNLSGAGVFEARNSATSGAGLYVNSSDRVGIGTATPAEKFQIGGLANTARISGVATGGSFLGTTGASTDKLLFGDLNGTVRGLNNGTANSILVINSTTLAPTWTNADGLFWKVKGNLSTIPPAGIAGPATVAISAASNNWIGTNDAQDWVIATNQIEKMRVTSAGKVGIGTGLPNSRLDVVGGATGVDNLLLTLRSPFAADNTGSGIRFINSVSTTSDAGAEIIGKTLSTTSGRSDLILNVHGGGGTSGALLERMRVLGNGNVGINNSTAANRLHVNGSTATTFTNPGSYAIGLGFGTLTTATTDLTLGSDASFAAIQSWGNKPLLMNSQGNFIGVNMTTAPIQNVDINGRLAVQNGVIQRGTNQINVTSDLGLYSQVAGNFIRVATNAAPIKFYTDQGGGNSAGTNAVMSVENLSGGAVVINAETTGAGNAGTTSASAALDVVSSTKGVLFPRMTRVQRNAIVGPTQGLHIYNTDEQCLNYWDQAQLIWNSYCCPITVRTISSSGNAINVFNLFGSVAQPRCLILRINAGVTVGGGFGGGCGAPALDCSNFPSGTRLDIINNGVIRGKGGDGGAGGRESDGVCSGDLTGNPGGCGGDAIVGASGVQLTITNTGVIAGGGGGGGGGGYGCCASSGGGGGGAGIPAGGGGGTFTSSCTQGFVCTSCSRNATGAGGAAGNITGGGGGGAGQNSGTTGCPTCNGNGATSGGAGGGPALNGANGGGGTGNGGGGVAGFALRGNGGGSTISGGTVNGTVQP